MNTPSSSPAGVDVRPYNDGTVTRLRYRGWILDVDSAGSITAPRQTVAGVVDDLAVCLDAAHTVAATNKAAARTAAAAAKPQPAPEPIAATRDRRPRLRASVLGDKVENRLALAMHRRARTPPSTIDHRSGRCDGSHLPVSPVQIFAENCSART